MNPATLRQLEYFVAAVDTGTLSAAAARCSASQAAVSTALQDLERGLGMQLLLRRPSRGVAITPGGERVLPLARRILADADELARVAGAEHDELSGPLRLASTIALSPRVLPVLADAFAARHPRVRLELTDALATSVQELLRAGTVDACLLYRRQLAHRFDVHPVCSIVPYAVLAEDHPLAGAEEVLLEQLKDERLIIVQPAGSRA